MELPVISKTRGALSIEITMSSSLVWSAFSIFPTPMVISTFDVLLSKNLNSTVASLIIPSTATVIISIILILVSVVVKSSIVNVSTKTSSVNRNTKVLFPSLAPISSSVIILVFEVTESPPRVTVSSSAIPTFPLLSVKPVALIVIVSASLTLL